MKETLRRLFAIHCFLALTLTAEVVSAQNASPLSLGVPASGTISTEGEVDWYSVTTDTIGDLAVTQTVWPPYIETRIAIFGPNNQTSAQANPVTAAAPGTYFIKVWSATNGVSVDVYTFSATLKKADTGNDIDGGKNGAAQAVPITLGKAVSDTIAPSKETTAVQDVDWFTVTTDTVGDLLVTQTDWPPYIETRIAIYGPESDTLAQSNPVTAAAPGKYFIKVWSSNDGSSIALYTFSCTLDKAKTGNDIDKGANLAAGAVPIVIGTPVSDSIAPSAATAGKQDVDWFTVTLPAIGDLSFTQTEWPPYLETQIAIFGPNSDTLAESNPITKAAPGTYYFKVWSATSGSSIAPYTFTVNYSGSPIDAGTLPAPPDAGVALDTPNGSVDSGIPDIAVAALDGGRMDTFTAVLIPDAGPIDRATSNGAATTSKPSGSSGGGCTYAIADTVSKKNGSEFVLLGLILLVLCSSRKTRG